MKLWTLYYFLHRKVFKKLQFQKFKVSSSTSSLEGAKVPEFANIHFETKFNFKKKPEINQGLKKLENENLLKKLKNL